MRLVRRHKEGACIRSTISAAMEKQGTSGVPASRSKNENEEMVSILFCFPPAPTVITAI
jgi:hypothetical protein